MKVIIKKFNVDWLEIKNECRSTVNMEYSNIEPNEIWKKKLLICRHSPLRLGTILIHFEDVQYYVAMHLCRHVHATPFVVTSREDRTGIPREERKQTDLINFDMYMNIEEFMNISERRLCTCADINTLKLWKMVVEEIGNYDKAIEWASVPQCVAHGGCIEPFSKCEYYNSLGINETDVIKRYDLFNKKR